MFAVDNGIFTGNYTLADICWIIAALLFLLVSLDGSVNLRKDFTHRIGWLAFAFVAVGLLVQ